MTTIEIELPDATAQAARKAGLLTPEVLARLLTDALKRREAADALRSIAPALEAAGVPPLSEQEIAAEINAYRAERKQRAGSH